MTSNTWSVLFVALILGASPTCCNGKCASGSPSNCKAKNIPVVGYSPGQLIRISNGRSVKKTGEKHSCPTGFKIWSPRNKNDWTIVYNAMSKNINNYPKKPHLIVDVTRPANGCGGCRNYAMKSGVSQQGSWKTTDGSDWWLRDGRYNEPNGDYHANCYLHIYDVKPNDVKFNDGSCSYSSTDYLCQPIQKTTTTTTVTTTRMTTATTTISTTATTTTKRTLNDQECNRETSGYLQNSPGTVPSLELCSSFCKKSTECMAITFYPKSKFCSHFNTTCTDLVSSPGATTIRFQPKNPSVGWAFVGYGKECDTDSNNYLESSSRKYGKLKQCLDACEQSTNGCRSVSFFSDGHCSHFSGTCEETEVLEGAISFRITTVVTTTTTIATNTLSTSPPTTTAATTTATTTDKTISPTTSSTTKATTTTTKPVTTKMTSSTTPAATSSKQTTTTTAQTGQIANKITDADDGPDAGVAVGVSVVIIIILAAIAAVVVVLVLKARGNEKKSGDDKMRRTTRSVMLTPRDSELEIDADENSPSNRLDWTESTIEMVAMDQNSSGNDAVAPGMDSESKTNATMVEELIVEERRMPSAPPEESDANTILEEEQTASAVSAALATAATVDGAKTNAKTASTSSKKRTFSTSNYKRYYGEAKAPVFYHQLLHNVYAVLQLYTARINPTLDKPMLEKGLNDFMGQIQDDAFKNNKTLQTVDAVAEYLWTSCKRHAIVREMELCSVLNAVIRDDIEDEIKAAAMIFRSINSRRVMRIEDSSDGVDPTYPKKGETWRGGGFRKRFRAFFVVGKKYRVPGFLATSSKRSVAAKFAIDPTKTHPCAIWRIVFDPRGKLHPEYRVQHMTFVTKTLIKGENEYLFAPYSVFTVMSVEWSEKRRKPHEFSIRAAVDNQEEPENLPLAPWY